MKKAILLFPLILIQMSPAQEFLSAADSDPNKLGWMQGFPPPQDRIISALDGTFFKFPALRYSVCHMREFFPSKLVPAPLINRYSFSTAQDSAIDSLSFRPLGDEKSISWAESLLKNYTDGILILHKGRIIYEKYFGALTQEGIHAAMSVSKTFTGTLAAQLIAEGLLVENKYCRDYVPELAHSAFGDATVRQVLDMTTGLEFSEDYADPNAEIWAFSKAGDPFHFQRSSDEPANYFDYLKTVKKKGQHGDAFGYKTVNTDVMGWIISRVLNKPLSQVLSEKIWQPLGANFDAYYLIDGAGICFAGGGLSANLRDMAMFGEMVRNKGYFNGKQILAKEVVESIRSGGSQPAFAKAGYTNLKQWSYKNMWWVSHNADGAFCARGVHGQTIYIDPKAEMVIVRFASHPIASNSANDAYSLPAYQAVADYLLKK
ncbi:6-aminohexanoate hydrolase [Sphingobacterium sp. CZ-UAM]|uniref:serine hydrolase domain-containing protein n=1 Tax=Sphingobacterium sp. CZ-UAM TaxID=1933868 RepID=UPI0009877415|nr:serine hydrolase [Sphingobacterium sp. CZ-UAM]OOG17800.1 6-aminohexanoate hydrolase [Sphingobacterium sp. CZ-UAM]